MAMAMEVSGGRSHGGLDKWSKADFARGLGDREGAGEE